MNIATKNKKISILALASIMILASLYYFLIYSSHHPLVHIQAMYKGYATVDELYNDADAVLIGSPTKEFDKRDHKATKYASGVIQDLYTVTEIKIDKIIKSPADINNANSINLIEPITEIQEIDGKKLYSFEDYTAMKKGSKYLIFLKKNTLGDYSVINMQKGKFNLDSSDDLDLKAEGDKKSFKDEVIKKLVTQ